MPLPLACSLSSKIQKFDQLPAAMLEELREEFVKMLRQVTPMPTTGKTGMLVIGGCCKSLYGKGLWLVVGGEQQPAS